MKMRLLALALLAGSTCVICVSSAVSAAPNRPAAVQQLSGTVQTAAITASSSSTASPSTSSTASVSAARAAANTGSASQLETPSASGQSSTTPSGGVGTATSTTADTEASPAWLAEINRYRAAAGLAPVTDQPAWDAGIKRHLIYATHVQQSDMVGPYASLHTENPSSRYYTASGALEASRSDLYFGAPGSSAVDFIDGWLSAPFHAIGILRAQLTQVAFASSGGAAGLDVISGLGSDRPAASAPILFPGNAMTTNLSRYTGSESPDPIESCDWGVDAATDSTFGLPLIALLPNRSTGPIAAQVTGPDGLSLSSQGGDLCVVDESTYRSSDHVYGPTGAELIKGDHVVLLIARHPYSAGQYTATIRPAGQSKISWSFTVAG